MRTLKKPCKNNVFLYVFIDFSMLEGTWGFKITKINEKRPRELKNEAKRGKRGEKEATREAQRRPKRGQGGAKVVRLTSMGVRGDYIQSAAHNRRASEWDESCEARSVWKR